MKRNIVLLLLSILTCNAFAQNIIPKPVEIESLAGVFKITKATTIGAGDEESRKIAAMLAAKLKNAAGFAPAINKTGAIQFSINTTPNNKIGNEGYTLLAHSTGVKIAANKPAGLFYGLQSLLQLLPKEIESKTVVKNVRWTIPGVKITDYPRFGWRGLMLDVSRHFFPKEDVKRYIDDMVRYKFNTLHWHLTDDNGWRIEIKSLPKLTEVGAWRVERAGRFGDRKEPQEGEPATYGGFYTQDDIREIIKYAADRGVTILPEVDVPGHSMAALAAYPELSCSKNPKTKVNPGTNFAEWYGDGKFRMFIDNTLNPSDEKVYDFLDKVFTEMAALFPNKYIHVGGDECYKGFWEKDPGCQALMKKMGMTHVEELQGYFMKRVEKILNAQGKQLLGWDEILEGGISPTATVMSWRGVKGGIEAAKMKHNVVMTPTTFAYLDYMQGDASIEPPIYASLRLSKTYSFEPVPDEVDAKYILGGQGNLWTEQIPTIRYAEYMTYPRAWALSDIYWSAKGSKDWANFTKRMEAHFDRADVAEMGYSKAVYDAIVNASIKDGKLMVELASEMPEIDIYYTTDDTMPDNFSKKYTEPIEIADAQVTLRIVTYKKKTAIGHLITLKREDLLKRAGK
ncbi:beta-N-acetylhexosaminidase [Emticicia sp. TH156]|uniref:beta-N-acetylhexosaminidase n=1 Tax=Emticicia sp. TH156 TaxID=2067454 RepID=UPI000C75C109|nr:family 20 glycosylhydrolase [Emticicia sp. TH156]PLK42372.1 beta-N-acetylhexosaminidase [Emticicia sp. TH156]